MYEQIEKTMDNQKKNANVIVMGDFNAIVGEERKSSWEMWTRKKKRQRTKVD